MRLIAVPLFALLAFATVLFAQSQTTVVVPAASGQVTSAQAAAVADNSAALQEALRMLQEMKASNEETLRKQTATLEQLDELEKTAEQLKIYTKRG